MSMSDSRDFAAFLTMPCSTSDHGACHTSHYTMICTCDCHVAEVQARLGAAGQGSTVDPAYLRSLRADPRSVYNRP